MTSLLFVRRQVGGKRMVLETAGEPKGKTSESSDRTTVRGRSANKFRIEWQLSAKPELE